MTSHPNCADCWRDRLPEGQAALAEGKSGELVYFVFDLVFLEGQDLRSLPPVQNKSLKASDLHTPGPAGPVP